MKKNLSLRIILLISFTLISAIPVIFLASWVQQSALKKELAAVEEKHLIIAKNITGALSRYVTDVRASFSVAAEVSQSDQTLSTFYPVLRELHFKRIWKIADQDQILKLMTKAEEEHATQLSYSPSYLKNILASVKFDDATIQFSGVVQNPAGIPVLYVIKRLEKNSYLLGELGTEYIRKVQKAITFGERGHAAIVDQYGRVLAHPVEEWRTTRKDITFLPPVKSMLKQVTGVTQFYTPAMQADMIAGHTYVENSGWGVMIPQPVEELEERAKDVQFIALFITVSGIIVAGFISWWVASFITRPIASVVNSTRVIATGNLTTYLPDIKRFSPVELRQLATSFNKMIDKLKIKTEQLIATSEKLEESQRMAHLGNWELNTTNKEMWWSDEVYRILGISKSEKTPQLDMFLDSIHLEDKVPFHSEFENAIHNSVPFSMDHRVISHEDNQVKYVHQDVVVRSDPHSGLLYVTGTIQDISERKTYEDKLFYQAHYDTITGLPNRELCLDRLNQALSVARREQQVGAFLLVGLDHFKEINESLGHLAGDRVLKMAGQGLVECVRDNDTVGRLANDEFAIVLANIKEIENIGIVAEKIIKTLSQPLQVDEYEVVVGASIGVSIFPEDTDKSSEILQMADTALHSVKASGRGTYCLFTADMNERVLTRMNLRAELQQALTNNEFYLVYQPILDLQSGEVVSAEALIRWNHPRRGFVPPDQFIPLAEESGLIADIGLWVLQTACAELKSWQQNGRPDMKVSINLSVRQIQLGLTTDAVLDVLNDAGIAAQSVTLEVTESMIMDNVETYTNWMQVLTDAGLNFSLDDFGTGYSSLSYLVNLPVRTIKIDRSFIMNIPNNEKDSTLVRAIISFSQRLGFSLVAEGVENTEHVEYLKQNQCDMVQGYYYSRPLPAAEIAEFLSINNKEKALS